MSPPLASNVGPYYMLNELHWMIVASFTPVNSSFCFCFCFSSPPVCCAKIHCFRHSLLFFPCASHASCFFCFENDWMGLDRLIAVAPAHDDCCFAFVWAAEAVARIQEVVASKTGVDKTLRSFIDLLIVVFIFSDHPD